MGNGKARFVPLIETVAAHERALMDELAAAQEEAQQMRDAARRTADELARSAREELDREVAHLRGQAQGDRARLRSEAAEAADAGAARLREVTAGRIPDAVAAVLELVLPAPPGGRPA